VIVGHVATPSVLGQLGIGTQVAEAGRLLSGAALSPIVSRLAITHGAGDRDGFDWLFERLHRLWTLLVIGGTVIGILVLYPLIVSWLGDGHEQAVWFGAALILAYGLNLLTGTPVAYLRALGQVSLEARLGAVLIGFNVVLTIALGIAFGAGGVVAATAIAYLLATAWFVRAFHRSVRPGVGRIRRSLLLRGLGLALLVGGLGLAWGLAMVELLPRGASFVAVAVGIVAAGVAYVALVARTPPSPAGLRQIATEGIG